MGCHAEPDPGDAGEVLRRSAVALVPDVSDRFTALLPTRLSDPLGGTGNHGGHNRRSDQDEAVLTPKVEAALLPYTAVPHGTVWAVTWH
jgi:hypothetical protein